MAVGRGSRVTTSSSRSARVRELISLTGQFAALDKNLTARENLVLMARLRGRRHREARRIADELIERFDVGPFRDRLVKQLSGGERRRVDLAAGLIDRPHVLVLDEPTTGLDPRSRQVVWATIRELVLDGVTLLLTTQYLEEADALADRVVLIDHGREVGVGDPGTAQGTGRPAARRRDRRRRRLVRSDAGAARRPLRCQAAARAADDLGGRARARRPTSPASPRPSRRRASASTRSRCGARRSMTRSSR